MTDRNQSIVQLCAPDWLGLLPLTGVFTYTNIFPGYYCAPVTFSESAQRLDSGTAKAAFISSISYAYLRRRHNLVTVPDLVWSTRFQSATAMLIFNKGLATLRSIAVDERSPAETILLKILLKEKFRIDPELIPMPPDLPSMLNRADAALITGNEAFVTRNICDNGIDLIEEWEDLTDGLPFVSGFWAGMKEQLNSTIVADLLRASREGILQIESLIQNFINQHSDIVTEQIATDYCRNLSNYIFGEEEKNSLSEFFSYCYYFGWIDEIPELRV